MEVAYIAGSYRAPTVYGIKQNIQKAEDVTVKYLKKGYIVFCPHKAWGFLDGSLSDTDGERWLVFGIEMLKRCDVIIMMRDWRSSEGACAEHQIAKERGLKVIYD